MLGLIRTCNHSRLYLNFFSSDIVGIAFHISCTTQQNIQSKQRETLHLILLTLQNIEIYPVLGKKDDGDSGEQEHLFIILCYVAQDGKHLLKEQSFKETHFYPQFVATVDYIKVFHFSEHTVLVHDLFLLMY